MILGAGTGPVAINSSSNPIAYYYVSGGNPTVTYTVNNVSSSARFNVAAPSGNIQGTATPPFLTSTSIKVGMSMSASLTQPPGYSGTNTWVQVINSTSPGFYDSNGNKVATCTISTNPVFPALDANYPYPYGSGSNASDGPDFGLPTPPPASVLKVQQNQGFSMYLLWQPTGVGTSFPVPVDYLQWSWTGTAQWSGSAWSVVIPSLVGQGGGATTSYPMWSSTVGSPTIYNCH